MARNRSIGVRGSTECQDPRFPSTVSMQPSEVIVGVPQEIKADERRVALTPAGARELIRAGHSVLVETTAGAGSGFSDSEYLKAGARCATVDEVFDEAELIVKVKEPQPTEVKRLTERHTLFTYLHLAADPELAMALSERGVRCIAYETVEDRDGRRPLLAPMSEVAGKLSAHYGALALTAPAGGLGTLIGGVPGVAAAEVLVVGGGTAGASAAAVASGMGARVTVIDRFLERLRGLAERFEGSVRTLFASDLAIAQLFPHSDLVYRRGPRRGRPGTESCVSRAPWEHGERQCSLWS